MPQHMTDPKKGRPAPIFPLRPQHVFGEGLAFLHLEDSPENHLQALSETHEVVAYSWPGHFARLFEAFKPCLDSFTSGSIWPAQRNSKENKFKTISRPRLALLLIAHAATLAENGMMCEGGSAVGDYLYLYPYLYLIFISNIYLYIYFYIYRYLYGYLSIYLSR